MQYPKNTVDINLIAFSFDETRVKLNGNFYHRMVKESKLAVVRETKTELFGYSRLTLVRRAKKKYIQGVPESIDYFSRGDRGTPDEQKIISERGI